MQTRKSNKAQALQGRYSNYYHVLLENLNLAKQYHAQKRNAT